MANFLSTSSSSSSRRRRSRTKNIPAKNSDSDNSVRCKKHPKHRQSPGVCSLCLNEKLSKLSLDYNYNTSARYNVANTTTRSSCSSSSSSSSISSYNSSVSSCLSPLHHRYNEVAKKKKEMKKQGFLVRLLG